MFLKSYISIEFILAFFYSVAFLYMLFSIWLILRWLFSSRRFCSAAFLYTYRVDQSYIYFISKISIYWTQNCLLQFKKYNIIVFISLHIFISIAIGVRPKMAMMFETGWHRLRGFHLPARAHETVYQLPILSLIISMTFGLQTCTTNI